jgi:hypothetical protein
VCIPLLAIIALLYSYYYYKHEYHSILCRELCQSDPAIAAVRAEGDVARRASMNGKQASRDNIDVLPSRTYAASMDTKSRRGGPLLLFTMIK